MFLSQCLLRLLLLCSTLAVLLMMSTTAAASIAAEKTPSVDTAMPSSIESIISLATLTPPPPVVRHYTVANNDTLAGILARQNIPLTTLQQLLATDVNVLALDKLRPGQELTFICKNNDLVRFEIRTSLSKKVVYQREGLSSFSYQEQDIEGIWQTQRIIGHVQYSYSGSAIKAGLTKEESQFASELLRNRIDFAHQIQPNDRFEFLVDRLYIDGKRTNTSRLRMARIFNKNKVVAAYFYQGEYYDGNGKSLQNTLQRLPVHDKYWISSSFDLERRHPITQLIRPHNGTDFAVPVGTPVFSTGDGVVVRVRKHKYAGLFIEIDHANGYSTRYLHLSQALVKQGDHVNRNQEIALSGNSGRSSGPHLHFELHNNGVAVDAMTQLLPTPHPISKARLLEFHQQIARYQASISQYQLALADN